MLLYRNLKIRKKHMKKNVLTTDRTTAVLYATIVAAVLVGVFSVYSIARAEITTQLDLGSQGSDVSELQSYLSTNPMLYPSGLVTGYFGTMTEGGVQKFQTSQGLVSQGTPATTGFGRVGPVTMARLNSLMGGVYNPGGDHYAPWIYKGTVSVGKNEAVISWKTGETAISRVMYNTSWPFLYATAPSVRANKYSTSAVIVLTNLKSNTTYYYTRESVDSSGNIMWTAHESFKTK